jgi:hypothetical protein
MVLRARSTVSKSMTGGNVDNSSGRTFPPPAASTGQIHLTVADFCTNYGSKQACKTVTETQELLLLQMAQHTAIGQKLAASSVRSTLSAHVWE